MEISTVRENRASHECRGAPEIGVHAASMMLIEQYRGRASDERTRKKGLPLGSSESRQTYESLLRISESTPARKRKASSKKPTCLSQARLDPLPPNAAAFQGRLLC